MKKILPLIILILIGFNSFAQKKSRYVIEFDNVTGEPIFVKDTALKIKPIFPLYGNISANNELEFGVDLSGIVPGGVSASPRKTFVPSVISITGQKIFTFPYVPENYADYRITKDGLILEPLVRYINSGNNTITIIGTPVVSKNTRIGIIYL